MTEHVRQDPIVDEVRRQREALVRASGGTLDSLFALIKDRQEHEAKGLVKLPARRPDAAGPGPSATDAA
jgi:hypothetical protein